MQLHADLAVGSSNPFKINPHFSPTLIGEILRSNQTNRSMVEIIINSRQKCRSSSQGKPGSHVCPTQGQPGLGPVERKFNSFIALNQCIIIDVNKPLVQIGEQPCTPKFWN